MYISFFNLLQSVFHAMFPISFSFSFFLFQLFFALLLLVSVFCLFSSYFFIVMDYLSDQQISQVHPSI